MASRLLLLWKVFIVLLICGVFMDIYAQPLDGNRNARSVSIVYKRDALLKFRSSQATSPFCDLPEDCSCLKQRKRGKKGGLRVRLRWRKYNPPLPSIITGNCRSLRNKLDELHACSKFRYEYRESCLMCFSETWFTKADSTISTDIDGFICERMDKTAESGKLWVMHLC